MINEEFIKSIKLYVRDSAINDSIELLEEPIGRRPSIKDKEKSEFYNKLNIKEKEIIKNIVVEAIDLSLFGFFTVLDGVRMIEEEKPKYELYRVTSEKKELLNDDNEEYLHDIFNSLVQEE